jgi:hypothetical protein
MSNKDFYFYLDRAHNDLLAIDKTVIIDEDETLPCIFFDKKLSAFSTTIVELSHINEHCVLISHVRAKKIGKNLIDFLDRGEP